MPLNGFNGQLNGPNYYELLGLKPNASVQDIRRAYRDLSKLYHPDTTQLESAIATVKFQALNEAYATLSSPEKRLTYDLKMGYSRLSVMAVGDSFPAGQAGAATHNTKNLGKNYPANAYLDPTDRPLSAGELFALFILGITFVGCLLLVVTLSLTKADIAAIELKQMPLMPSAARHEQIISQPDTPDLPQQPWLIPQKTPPVSRADVLSKNALQYPIASPLTEQH
ncbi:MAG: J domain-containing protein [Phormidesmis sp. RL_2_1]|nr:J domain-containing protein [Phormidesmis sp. RL_2_1]